MITGFLVVDLFGGGLVENILFFALLGAILLTVIFGLQVRSRFRRYNTKEFTVSSGLTGEQAARAVLAHANVHDVEILMCKGELTDHYNPKTNTIYLSQGVIDSTSIAAVSVAAHEAGHAIQYAEAYSPVKMRTALVPAVNISSRLAMYFIMGALLLEIVLYATEFTYWLLVVGTVLYGVYALFTVMTLPVEFNASKRAKQLLYDAGIIDMNELTISNKVLRAAAMTYVASMAVALLQLLRLFMMLRRRR